MSSPTNNVSSIELVQSEVDSTIQQAEDSLGRFLENRDSGEDLQNCIDCLNQLRGIFVVIEVQSCILLCQESVALANEVPVGANDDKNALLANLSNAIFILRRYTEYYAQNQRDFPELLLPIINDLRIARKDKPFPESHFFEFDSARDFDITSVLSISQTSKLSDFEHHARRFRHMYQVGLLDLLKERNVSISLKLISRATHGSAKLCADQPLAQFWSLVALVVDTIHANDMVLTEARKRLFMRVERYLREMVYAGKVVATKPGPGSFRKEFVYILALSGDTSEEVQGVLSGFGVGQAPINETTLREETRRLFGPGVDVLRSLSKAISEEMVHIKEKLDVFERGGEPNQDDIEFICDGLKRLSGTLAMLDLPAIAALCEQQCGAVDAWKADQKLVTEDELLAVANAILTIESAIKYYEETGTQPAIEANTDLTEKSSQGYLSEAKIVVVEEAKAGLTLAKRSINSFIESQGDKLHLANTAQVLDGIRGGMQMIDKVRVAAIVSACAECINTEFFENNEMPDDTLLETLADALSSLEYYIESMSYKDSQNEDLLKLSEESLESIGYGVQS